MITREQQIALLKTPHFWVTALMALLDTLCGTRVIKADPDVLELLLALHGFLAMMLVLLASGWQAPRKSWTAEQRAAAGLPPESLPAQEKVGKADGGTVRSGHG